MLETQIKNSKGELIVLNDREAMIAKHNQELCNSLGFEIDITTLTALVKRIVEQKFFTIAPADYLPVRVGEGAWAASLTTFRDFSLGGDFEQGIINTASNNGRLGEADTAVDSVTVPIMNWAKQISWNLFDLQLAQRSGNWDIVTSKEKSRKKNWDLGIQKVAFLGSKVNSSVKGLFTQSDVTANTSLITGKISAMNAANFSALVQGLIEAYRANAQRTAMPTHFIIPEGDYNGLATLVPGTAGTFPIKMLDYLLEAFKTVTMNPNFKILPNAYADQSNNSDVSGLNKNRYTLLNYDEDSVRMDVPVDYTSTVQNSINNFQFQNVGYGQFTGVKAYRPREMLYLDYAS